MEQTKIVMGMPITIVILNSQDKKVIKEVFDYFRSIDKKFSTYKKYSEVSLINRGLLKKSEYSSDMKLILKLAQQSKDETDGYFNISKAGKLDPSGIVKGWAISQATKILRKKGVRNFYINAGGDIQVSGKTQERRKWLVGIKNPFNQNQIVKVLSLSNKGIATSGSYIRGDHIYNPHNPTHPIKDIVSLTVIGQDIYSADRFATAAYAMGKKGIEFIEQQKGLEGYMIDSLGIATFTSGFNKFVKNA